MPQTDNSPDVFAGQIGHPSADRTGQTQFVSFAVGNEQYGVDIMAVREIKGWSEITHLPRLPEHVRGVLNLRGAIVPIVDLRCRFGQGLTETTPLHIVIIVQIGDRQVGLIGDRVLDIVSIEMAEVQPVPRAAQGAAAFLAGLATHDGTMMALIDIPGLLSEQDGQVIDVTTAAHAMAGAGRQPATSRCSSNLI
jgi:purine-binding chemotaxis protein CheW